MKAAIGFVGTGSMGAPIAANLLARGYSLVINDIDSAAMHSLAKSGAEVASSPHDVASLCETVFVCLPTLESIREVVLGRAGLLHGSAIRTCVNCSTAGPRFIREIVGELAGGAITLVDCPITGGAQAPGRE